MKARSAPGELWTTSAVRNRDSGTPLVVIGVKVPPDSK